MPVRKLENYENRLGEIQLKKKEGKEKQSLGKLQENIGRYRIHTQGLSKMEMR